MANASNKTKLHPLERLDLVDIENLQNLAHNAADNYIGGVVGLTGLLDRPTSISVDNSTELITISDCSWLGWQSHHEGLSGSKYSAFYGYYRSVDLRNGDISFDAVRALVQSYYNTNGSLPPTPLDTDNYVPGTHGFAYPYVYAMTSIVDAEIEPRRFWSTNDANETTNNVATEMQQTHQFALVAREDAAPSDGEFPSIKIMRVAAWELDGDVVNLLTVIPVQLADNILNIYPRHLDISGNPFGVIHQNSKEGIPAAIAWLKERQDAIVDSGTFDLAGTDTGAYKHTLPRFSLHGLEKYLGDRINILEDKVKRATVIVKTRFNKPSGINDVTVHAWDDNDFVVLAYKDYSYLYDNTSTGGTVFSAPVAVSDISSVAEAERMLGALFIRIPEEYAGYGLQMNLTSIFPGQSLSYLDSTSDTSVVLTNNKRGLSEHWVINPGTGHDQADSVTAWARTMNEVSPSWAKNASDVTYASANGDYGVSIAHPMAVNEDSQSRLTNTILTDSDAIATLYLKVDITLIRP
jgi:hypothetical protein